MVNQHIIWDYSTQVALHDIRPRRLFLNDFCAMSPMSSELLKLLKITHTKLLKNLRIEGKIYQNIGQFLEINVSILRYYSDSDFGLLL